MGRVRTKTVKRSARQIVEKYHNKLTCDFQINKKIAEEVAQIPTKRLRNKIAGFVTHLMKRVRSGNVRGISLAVQQAERERRMDVMPEVSITECSDPLQVDDDTFEMLRAAGVGFTFSKPQAETTNYKTNKPNNNNRPRGNVPAGANW
jgi:small subunit ribosomal protein S17e